jgi:hypothetical protein
VCCKRWCYAWEIGPGALRLLLGAAFVVSEGAFGPERVVGLKYADRSAKMPSASKVSSQKFFSSMGKMQPEFRPGPENNIHS